MLSKVGLSVCLDFIFYLLHIHSVGNEQDYIIISLVRSRNLGFLTNLRRTNVMLTRCKKGMFIVSSRKFLTGPGSSTLVGTLMEKMGPDAWLEMEDIEGGNF
jgi:hypothetical protein